MKIVLFSVAFIPRICEPDRVCYQFIQTFASLAIFSLWRLAPNVYEVLMACRVIAIVTNHSGGKLLSVQFEFIGACFPLVDICIDHVALRESNLAF